MRLTSLVWLAAWWSLLLGTAQAQEVHEARDQEARALFEAGSVAMSDGRYEDALGHFERAYDLSKRPTMLFNIGAVAERLRMKERARDAYRAYLDALPEAKNRLEVERRIELIEQDLTRDRALSAPLAASGATEAQSRDRPWYKNYWLWGAAGAVLVGVGVGVVVAAQGADKEQEAPLRGADGSVTYTLSQRF